MIEEFYGDRVAKRSGVPLLNHIYEGVTILNYLGASENTIEAFRLHPMFQTDKDLADNHPKMLSMRRPVVIFLMEYRNIANASLSDIVFRDYSRDWCPLTLRRAIKISPLEEVNQMLIADKIQNYKDFRKYHHGTHPRSDELEFYFRHWHKALDLSSARVHELMGIIE